MLMTHGTRGVDTAQRPGEGADAMCSRWEWGCSTTQKEGHATRGDRSEQRQNDKNKKLTQVVTRASMQPEEVQWVEASTNRDAALDGTMQEVRVSERRKTTEKKDAHINAWGGGPKRGSKGRVWHSKKSISKANNVNKRKTYYDVGEDVNKGHSRRCRSADTEGAWLKLQHMPKSPDPSSTFPCIQMLS